MSATHTIEPPILTWLRARQKWVFPVVWLFNVGTLGATAFFNEPSLPGLAISLSLLSLTCLTAVLTAMPFRRLLANPLALAVMGMVASAAQSLVVGAQSTSVSSSQTVSAVLTILSAASLNASVLVGAVAFWWGWYRKGGWTLLALAPALLVWVPVGIALGTSPASFIDSIIGVRPPVPGWQATMCVSCWAVPIGLLTVALELGRAAHREATSD